MTTIIYKNREPKSLSASMVDGEDLWLPVEQLEEITGLELKSEGVCFDELCVPLPTNKESWFLRENNRQFNICAFARLMGQPIVYSEKHQTWLFGESDKTLSHKLHSLQAPDFTLPDQNGRMHSLSDYFGKKIFLVSWASW